MSATALGGAGADLPAAEDKKATVEAMFDRIAGNYERVNRVISLGLDRRWRRRAVEALGLDSGALVLDLACGTGDMSRLLGASGYAAVGLDLSMNMLREVQGPEPVVRADVCRLPLPDGAADGIVCGFALRNLVDLAAFFGECARALRPGGRIAVVDPPAGFTTCFRVRLPLEVEV